MMMQKQSHVRGDGWEEVELTEGGRSKKKTRVTQWWLPWANGGGRGWDNDQKGETEYMVGRKNEDGMSRKDGEDANTKEEHSRKWWFGEREAYDELRLVMFGVIGVIDESSVQTSTHISHQNRNWIQSRRLQRARDKGFGQRIQVGAEACLGGKKVDRKCWKRSMTDRDGIGV